MRQPVCFLGRRKKCEDARGENRRGIRSFLSPSRTRVLPSPGYKKNYQSLLSLRTQTYFRSWKIRLCPQAIGERRHVTRWQCQHEVERPRGRTRNYCWEKGLLSFSFPGFVPGATLSEALTKRNAALGTRMAVVRRLRALARRVSLKRYANFAKSVVDHLEHLALYHLMWNPKTENGPNVLSKRKEIRHTLSKLSTFLTISGQTQQRQCGDKGETSHWKQKYTPKRFQRITLLGFTSSQRLFTYRLQFQEVSGHNFNVLASKKWWKLWSSLFV